ncbi:hypothetical protein EA462_00270 [Natrarchaeobius halalkaliphilus]|uniref:HVO-0234-like beta-propeller domain-containing protein n=1 Tax=Natrarchaeobius halalkaliphilus TaxID=1679091 RepID=A0A3N6LZC9_9EURY|nr:hypothetical protein [Natrarchaeobius halalkaliphilus]RQG93274.1 hypothetical protein EA462_00270 [Natrarchaeobius halalkaliphilus]
MDSIEEKRVYGDRDGALEAYVTSSIGVVRVRVAGDTVGEFGLCERCDARDVTATDDVVAIATEEDVRVYDLESGVGSAEGTDDEPTFAETGFGSAVAVGADGPDLIAAGDDGRVARRRAGTDRWEPLAADAVGGADSERPGIGTVRAIDGDLVGTETGVYRIHDGGLDHAGLTAVNDVSTPGVPLAATDDGLYKLGNGWMEILEESFESVTADPRSEPGRLVRAHATAGDTIYALEGGEWHATGSAGAPIVAIRYGETVYAVTEDGGFCATGEGGWRTHPLGIDGVTGLAIAAARSDSSH